MLGTTINLYLCDWLMTHYLYWVSIFLTYVGIEPMVGIISLSVKQTDNGHTYTNPCLCTLLVYISLYVSCVVQLVFKSLYSVFCLLWCSHWLGKAFWLNKSSHYTKDPGVSFLQCSLYADLRNWWVCYGRCRCTPSRWTTIILLLWGK